MLLDLDYGRAAKVIEVGGELSRGQHDGMTT